MLAEARETALSNVSWSTQRIPWSLPCNVATGAPYRDTNAYALRTAMTVKDTPIPLFGTYRQLAALGVQVRRGAQGTHVFFMRYSHQLPAGADGALADRSVWTNSTAEPTPGADWDGAARIASSVFNLATDTVRGDGTPAAIVADRLVDTYVAQAQAAHARHAATAADERCNHVRSAFIAYASRQRMAIECDDTRDPTDRPDGRGNTMRVWSRRAPVADRVRALVLLAVVARNAVSSSTARWKRAPSALLVAVASHIAACQLADIFGIDRTDETCAQLPRALWPGRSEWDDSRWGDNITLSRMLLDAACRAASHVLAAYYVDVLFAREDILARAAVILCGGLPAEMLAHIVSFIPDYPLFIPATRATCAEEASEVRRGIMKRFLQAVESSTAVATSSVDYTGPVDDCMHADKEEPEVTMPE